RRGASDAHTLQGSVRSEQRSLGRKEPPPEGLRRFSVLASLLLGHSPTSGDAPSSRLARTENRRNKRGRIYEMGYLAPSPQSAPLLGEYLVNGVPSSAAEIAGRDTPANSDASTRVQAAVAEDGRTPLNTCLWRTLAARLRLRSCRRVNR